MNQDEPRKMLEPLVIEHLTMEKHSIIFDRKRNHEKTSQQKEHLHGDVKLPEGDRAGMMATG